jgi:hypothetical protein
MISYRIRVGKDYFNDPHYITTFKIKHDDLVDVNYTSTCISKSFYEVKRIKNIESLYDKLKHYCYVNDGNIDFYEIEIIEK